MKRVPIRNAKGETLAHALVDDADYERLTRHRWCFGSDGYVVRGTYMDGKKILLPMHREILGLRPHDVLVGDHINHDKLDNRRSNLRAITRAWNQQNHHGQKGKTSKYVGVCYIRRRRKWRASVSISYKRHYIGNFDTELEAAIAYDEYCKKHQPGHVALF